MKRLIVYAACLVLATAWDCEESQAADNDMTAKVIVGVVLVTVLGLVVFAFGVRDIHG